MRRGGHSILGTPGNMEDIIPFLPNALPTQNHPYLAARMQAGNAINVTSGQACLVRYVNDNYSNKKFNSLERVTSHIY